MRFPLRIRCALCQRPVDRIEVENNSAQRKFIISAFCHGKRDEMEISDWDAQGGPFRLFAGQEGVAFRQDLIEVQP